MVIHSFIRCRPTIVVKSVIQCIVLFEKQVVTFIEKHMLTVKDGKNESSVPLFFIAAKRNMFPTILKRVCGFFLITMNESSLRTDIYDHRNVIKQ